MTRVRLFHTPSNPCGYLPERSAQSLVVDPWVLDAGLYSNLAAQGYRRSGEHVYRPACPGCQACVALRLPVARLRLDRSMRRCLNRNADLRLEVSPSQPSEESLRLFQRYLSTRHAGAEPPPPTLEDFTQFLLSSWCETLFLEWRSATGELLAVAVTDRLEGALSAVYTYFAPECGARSLGTYAVLQQAEMARQQGLRWLYLGYWVEGCRKMSYKCRFRPHQILQQAGWHDVG